MWLLLITLFLVEFFCCPKMWLCFAWFIRHWFYHWLWNDRLKFLHVYFPITNVSHLPNDAFPFFSFLLLIEDLLGIHFRRVYWIGCLALISYLVRCLFNLQLKYEGHVCIIKTKTQTTYPYWDKRCTLLFPLSFMGKISQCFRECQCWNFHRCRGQKSVGR